MPESATRTNPQRLPRGEFKLVEFDEFCRLAVSRRNLVRCDEIASPHRALLDQATGTTYVIEESKLLLHTH